MDSVNAPTTLALRAPQAAAALGISPRTLWQLTKDGHIPCVRVGSGKRRMTLYPLPVLKDWLTRGSTKAGGGRNE
jgi:excisionase family DNA binding protein